MFSDIREKVSGVIERIKREREHAVLIDVLKGFVTEDSKPDIKKIKDSIPTQDDIDAIKKRIKHEDGE